MNERREDVRNDWLRYPTARKSSGITPAKRKAILKAGGGCHVCGGKASQVDHVKPVCMGGAHDDANLAPICRPCHLRKTSLEANHMRWHVHKRARRGVVEAVPPAPVKPCPSQNSHAHSSEFNE